MKLGYGWLSSPCCLAILGLLLISNAVSGNYHPQTLRLCAVTIRRPTGCNLSIEHGSKAASVQCMRCPICLARNWAYQSIICRPSTSCFGDTATGTHGLCAQLVRNLRAWRYNMAKTSGITASMESISSSQLDSFLTEIGERYNTPATLVLLGGSALCLLGSERPTFDVDYVGMICAKTSCKLLLTKLHRNYIFL